MTLSSIAHRASKLVADNSPAILTAVGVAGTVTTAVLAGQASIRAYQILDGHESIHGVSPDPKEKFKDRVYLVWREFVPPVISCVGTITCIIYANRIGTRRAAAMAAAYSLSQEAFTEYKAKVLEKLGENKERAFRDEIAQDRVRNNPPKGDLVVTSDTDVLCYEMFTGRYFMSSMEALKKAENEINFQILHNFDASLSDFYDRVGLHRTQVSEEVGWNVDNQCSLIFSTTMSDDDKPCLAFSYKVVPMRNYFRVH